MEIFRMAAGASTLTELVSTAGETHGSTVIEFITPDGREDIPLGEVLERAKHVAGGLRALGVRPRDRVTVQLSNRAESMVLQFAVLMLDAVLAPVVPVFGPREVAQVLGDSRPTVYVTQRRWNKFDYLAALAELPGGAMPDKVVVVDGAPEGYIDWSQLEAAEPIEPVEDVDESAVCLIVYTSGSTGVPKGVQHSRASIFAEALDYDYRPHADSEVDVYLQGSAAGHIGGYMFPIRAVLYQMRTLVLDGWNASLACSLVESEKVTAMVATPFHLVQMLEVVEQSGGDLSSMDMMMIGGAPVPPSLIRRADAVGLTAVRAYGMSEHPTFAIGSWRDPLDVRAEHDGYITGANQVRLVDDEGVVVPTGMPGEVHVRGPEQFLGYTNVPDDEVFTPDGWFPTGDIAVQDDNGILTVVDRKKNIIIRGGENLSATEIESVVATHPAVAEVAVIGVPDERYGERAAAYVVLNEGRTLELPDLLQHFLDSGVAKQKVPEFLHFLQVLPRTGTGKLRKHELIRMRADG
jgi:acyl-CoA synthetase (AMP-forming)/AMP-acid ligase II